MTATKSSLEDLLGESWVDVSNLPNESLANTLIETASNSTVASNASNGSHGTATPASVVDLINPNLSPEEYLRLLGEAQRDSNQSSIKGSVAGSRKGSPRSSPKSPPNSPVQGTQICVDWQSYYINPEAKELQEQEIPTSWSSRPEQAPPKNWNFRTPKRDLLSIRYARVGDTSVFSRKGLCTLFLTNLISLLLGTGVGLWLSRHGFFVQAVKVR